MPALMPNADCRYVIAGRWFLLLTLLSNLGCNSKSRAEYDKERFEEEISQVRAGNLDNLLFYDTHETDALLQSIVGLKGVRSVTFEYTDVTSAGFAAVAQLPDLHEVDFYETRIHDDRWFDALLSSQTLEIVGVDDYFSPPFFSVSKILALPHLRKLVVCVYVIEINGHVAEGRKWTDSALVELEQATSLEELELGGEFGERQADLIALQNKLPNCKISVVDLRTSKPVRKAVSELSAR